MAEWFAESAEHVGASWFAASDDASSPVLAQGGRELAEQTWRWIEQNMPTLSTWPTLKQSRDTPEVALERLEVLHSLLLALPQQMASGLEASLAQVDRLFARLLTAPERPGVIEQVIDALAAQSPVGELSAEQAALINELRALHRELVSLHQTWETLREGAFLEMFPTLASSRMAQEHQVEPVGTAVASMTSVPPPHGLTPLPAQGVVVRLTSSKTPATPVRLYPLSKYQQRRALMLAVLVLVIASIGVIFLQGHSNPATQVDTTVFSGTQHAPLEATPTSPTQPQPTLTPPASTPTPRLPAPSPPPTPGFPTQPPLGGLLCPTGSTFCVSTLQVFAPCSGDGSETFQLLNNSASKTKWQARYVPGPDGTYMAISPSAGQLNPSGIVTLTLHTSKQKHPLAGTIRIAGPDGTVPIMVAFNGCSS